LAGPLPKLLAATVLVVGTAWILPIHDDEPAGNNGNAATRVAPTFVIEARRDRLLLSGHTASAQHEMRLRRSVEAGFPALEPSFDFRPLGMVPDWWSDATTQLVEQLASMTSPTAVLAEDMLQISALVVDAASAHTSIDELRLPASVQRNVRFETIDSDILARSLCARQFGTFAALPIQFEESSTVLRQSAYPSLDKIASLADACRDATIVITGHTDSSGNEDWNRILSRRRAQAVADHLESLGIDGDRLEVEGLGSADPVADNATRHGRSLNRRIDVRFSSVD
jgi:outer membrane protein OmpA-like peptidoglycan-associated protein